MIAIATDGKQLDWIELTAPAENADHVAAVALDTVRTRLGIPKHRALVSVDVAGDTATITITLRGHSACYMAPTAHALAVQLRQSYGPVNVNEANPWPAATIARMKGKYGGRCRLNPGSLV
jgi:hypothetical protein